jgi:putative heme iron utilization protein
MNGRPEYGMDANGLVRKGRRAALATTDRESGAPYVSLVAVGTAFDGAPLLLISELAKHTQNLKADPRASLLFEDVGLTDPLAGARVSISGTATVTTDPDDRRRYLARQPTAASFADFKDFAFWRLQPESAHLVAGFGRIRTMPWSDIVTETADAAELLAAEEGAVAHMNEDHADALDLYAQKLLGAGESGWRAEGLDPEGLEISAGGKVLYLRFPEPVRGPGPLRLSLVALANAARNAR